MNEQKKGIYRDIINRVWDKVRDDKAFEEWLNVFDDPVEIDYLIATHNVLMLVTGIAKQLLDEEVK